MMRALDSLSFGFRRKLPVTLQTEAAECGLACMAMIASYHGNRIDLPTLRTRFSVSLRGTTLSTLIRIASQLQLATRPLKLELEDIPKLRLPCILHWSFNHFVVLRTIKRGSAVIHDPAFGERRVPLSEISQCFTGVALELWPAHTFERKKEIRRIKLRELTGRIVGAGQSIAQVLLLAVALEVFSLVAPFFLQWTIDHAIASADRDLLTTLALGFGLLVLMRVGVSFARAWVLMYLSTTFNVQWYSNVFSHLVRLPVEHFQKRHVGDVQSRFSSVEQIQSTVTSSFIEGLLDGLMSIFMLTVLYIYSAKLASIALLAAVFCAALRWAWYGPLRSATASQIVFTAKQQSHFLESIRGIRAIKLFNREQYRQSAWMSLLVDQVNAGLRSQKLTIAYSSAAGAIAGMVRILLVWLGATMVINGDFTVGVLVAFLAYSDQFSERVVSLIDKIWQVRMLEVHCERLADIVLSEPELTKEDLIRVSGPRSGDVVVSDLRFRYGEHDPLVLDGVSFSIKEGEIVAIIGASGCGKSTLVSMLLGVLPPLSGEIVIGGMNTKQASSAELREHVGTVMQDDVLFAGSLADNISFFDPQVDWSLVEQCAKIASVHDEIVAMPMGYNSLVGDMGTILSGGQRQRILLARALYRKPKILVLDEATSHLDVVREREVNDGVRSLGITTIIVAHRMETIASADRVIEIAGGKVVADLARPAAPVRPIGGYAFDGSQQTGTNA